MRLSIYGFFYLITLFLASTSIADSYFLLLAVASPCTAACLNGGECMPDSGKCACPTNCEGELCEVCHYNIPYVPVLISIGVLAVCVFFVKLLTDLIRRKCM